MIIGEGKERIVVASFKYEHDDGDQSWSYTTTYYKNADGTFEKKYEDGYYGETSITSVTEEEIINEMRKIKQEVQKEVQKRKEAIAMFGHTCSSARSGYAIIKDLQQKTEQIIEEAKSDEEERNL